VRARDRPSVFNAAPDLDQLVEVPLTATDIVRTTGLRLIEAETARIDVRLYSTGPVDDWTQAGARAARARGAFHIDVCVGQLDGK
jgi:hypothetical protein